MTYLYNCEFYCLSFNNINKKDMEERFNKLNIECNFYSGLQENDERINKSFLNKFCKRQWSITYSHLDMIYDYYYNTDKKYGIFCEDDILIHSHFNDIMKKVINDFNILELDILLLGYMVPYKLSVDNILSNYQLKKDMPLDSKFKYLNYPQYLTGTQMYMITKKYAKYLLDKYYYNYTSIINKQFICDKILIKNGNRALIYPMLAIENKNQCDLYHKLCNNIHYSEIYI